MGIEGDKNGGTSQSSCVADMRPEVLANRVYESARSVKTVDRDLAALAMVVISSQVSRRSKVVNVLQMPLSGVGLRSGTLGAQQVAPPLPWRDSLRTATRKAPKAIPSWAPPKKTPEQRRASAIAELKRLIPGGEP
jgi:hypothetical protein